MPVLSFFHQSKTVQDKKASLSMKIISLCWACFGVLTLFQVAAGGLLLPTSQSNGSVAGSPLLMLNGFGLRETTNLRRIVTSGEAVSRAVVSHPRNEKIT